MNVRLKQLLSQLRERFWLLPSLMVLASVALALALLEVDRRDIVPEWLLQRSFLYNGGGTGARTLLGAVASSSIGVAGTVFSITIAALSLAAGQMGPRLLRNFTRDLGNQFTLGVFLGTFSYALIVLRSVRTLEEGEFIPHLALSAAILLAFVCVGTLMYFVDHVATRINVDTVIDLVAEDVRSAVQRLTLKDPELQSHGAAKLTWRAAEAICLDKSGYLQIVDYDQLADWAEANDTALKLLVRPGDYVFPGAPIALSMRPVEGADTILRDVLVTGAQRASSSDLEYTIRQLVEVAVRALSPGTNDPNTAIGVLDRLGGALCELAKRHLHSGMWLRQGRPVLVAAATDYRGLTDVMFHTIRQNAQTSPAVLIRLLEVLTAVLSCERNAQRINILLSHADLIVADAQRADLNPADLNDVRSRRAALNDVVAATPISPMDSNP